MEHLDEKQLNVYESITEKQEQVILKAIEIGKTKDEIAPTEIGMALGYKKDRASSPTTTPLRKGIKLGVFEVVRYGVYRYTGEDYVAKY